MITCLLACWPLTFGVFSVKNDAIHYFLPFRYNIAEAIHHGEFPFWSPYIYQGYPVYGDMQSGAWNPVVWIFSLLGKYDLTIFHWENLLYVFISGVGMYKLVYYRSQHELTALFIGSSYMLSGFMLSGQLINWLAAGAFIPFVILYYWRGCSSGNYTDAIKTALALWMLLVAGYPSFFIITVYGLVVFFVFRVVENNKNRRIPWGRFAGLHLSMALIFLCLSLPALLSFIDLMPFYQRGDGTSFTEVLHNSFEGQHVLSLLFPSAIHVTDLVTTTDVTCRNMYLGILVLPVLIAFPPKPTARNILIIVLTLLAFLFCLGDATPLRKLAYDFLLLMDTFRHPSQARLFVMIGLLMLAVPGVKRLLNHPSKEDVRRFTVVSVVFLLCVLAITIIAALRSGNWKEGMGPNNIGIKNMIESVSLADTIFINGLVQLGTLGLGLLLLKRKHFRPAHFAGIAIVNLVLLAQFILPITFVSQTSPKDINSVIHSYPSGFPVPDLKKSLKENSGEMERHFVKMGSILFYNKKPGISKLTNTPSFLSQMDSFLVDEKMYDYVADQPMIYFAGVNVKEPGLIAGSDSLCRYVVTDRSFAGMAKCDSNAVSNVYATISSNTIRINAENSSPGILVVTQNFHPYWKATDKKTPIEIFQANKAFMGVYLAAGKHNLHFRFSPPHSLLLTLAPVLTLVVLLTVFVTGIIRKKRTEDQS